MSRDPKTALVLGPYIVVPNDVWETAFYCFAAYTGTSHHDPMPEAWADVFRFACDDEALKRLGVTPKRGAE